MDSSEHSRPIFPNDSALTMKLLEAQFTELLLELPEYQTFQEYVMTPKQDNCRYSL